MLNSSFEAPTHSTYQAFSALSTMLIKCQNAGEVEECLAQHLHAIISFDLFRLRFKCKQEEIVLMVANPESQSNNARLQLPKTQYEADAEKSHVTAVFDAVTVNSSEERIARTQRLWCWCFLAESVRDSAQTTIVCHESCDYSKGDVSLVRLVTETVLTKLKEIILIGRLKRFSLNQAQIIREKTQELEKKNASLLALTMHHAHNMREPLTRIMGLINVVDWSAPSSEVQTTYQYIGAAAQDLDDAIRLGVTTIEREGQKIKRENGIKKRHRVN